MKKGWTPQRTADGQPDLRAIWTNATITPFERPASLRDKPLLTEAEAEALERQGTTRREQDAGPRPGDVGSCNQLTNYNNKGWIATQAAAGPIKGIPQTESLHVVERFTPIDADTIDYQATIRNRSIPVRTAVPPL